MKTKLAHYVEKNKPLTLNTTEEILLGEILDTLNKLLEELKVALPKLGKLLSYLDNKGKEKKQKGTTTYPIGKE